jgi:uncharacterized protein YjgD (DUF1641 family)
MLDDIIKIDDRDNIIETLFELLESKNISDFIKKYDVFIKLLKTKNTNEDKRLTRLYNRLYYIFSYVLNSQKPEEFPIYFSKTR